MLERPLVRSHGNFICFDDPGEMVSEANVFLHINHVLGFSVVPQEKFEDAPSTYRIRFYVTSGERTFITKSASLKEISEALHLLNDSIPIL